MPPEVLLVLGLGAVFLAVLLGVVGAASVPRERQAVERSLAALTRRTGSPVAAAVRAEIDVPFADRVLAPIVGAVTRLGRAATPAGYTDRVWRRLDLAGVSAGWDADRVIAVKSLGLLTGVGLGVLLLSVGVGGPLWLALTVVAVLAGFFGPDLWLYQKAYDRSARIRNDLPDSLDLLSISVEAGLGFDAALAQVARNTDGPLSDELFRVLQEMQIGLNRAQALRGLTERTDLPELRTFVGSLIQADTLGIPMAQVLAVQASEQRLRRSQRAEEAAQKVPVKILFPLIFCILPALFIVVIGPAVVQIIRNIG